MRVIKKYKNPSGPLKWPGLRSVNFGVYPDNEFSGKYTTTRNNCKQVKYEIC